MNPRALRMAGKLRCVHALHARNAVGEIAFVRYAQWVFKDVSAFWQIVHKEIRRYVARAFVITQTALRFVLAQHVDRF